MRDRHVQENEEQRLSLLLHKTCGDGEADLKTGAAAIVYGALEIQMTFGFGYTTGDDRQAQAGALGLGGKKWLQDFFLQVRRNAGAVVLDGENAESIGLRCADSNMAVGRDGVECVDQNIGKDVVERFFADGGR